ncbi:MAG TPA: ferrous iron transport protein B [Thermoleophilia bacterium]|nr:ferrous iron transport protein B [Thermoleophilia bacterium]
MATSCCSQPEGVEVEAGGLVALLAGNPNVGKSSLFNRLTGEVVETANYAGMTVALNGTTLDWAGRRVNLLDLPGTYAIGAVSEDQRVARRALLEQHPDVVIAVVDATNLARNLYLVLQLLDLGFRLVLALNLADEAERQHLHIDAEKLGRALGLTVVRTVAPTGEGLERLVAVAVETATSTNGKGRGAPLRYSPALEERVAELAERLVPPPELRLSRRALALAVLEGDEELATLAGVEDALLEESDEDWPLRVARERHEAARRIAHECSDEHKGESADRLWRLATSPRSGLPILAGVLAATFALLFFVGGLLSTLLTTSWNATLGPAITSAVHALFGYGFIASTLLWGLNGGVLAILGVAIPYILTFYVLLAVLEDSGYLNAAAFLTDRVMHRFGLHGRAAIPLIAAFGCNVPAIMGTRVLTTMRERMIASVLITLTPCSARTAVILGAVALYAGWQWALFVYAVIFLVGFVAGVLLNRMLPGEPAPLVMEVFPLRRPQLRLVARKSWYRFKEFLVAAAPLILIGSFVLGALYESHLIWDLTAPLAPIVQGWLGLPAVAGLTLIFAVLRKELALQLLVAFAVVVYGASAHMLNSFMTPHQLVVYALVNAIYIPCVATIAMLGRELGWGRAAAVSAGTIAVAIAVGGVVAHALALL